MPDIIDTRRQGTWTDRWLGRKNAGAKQWGDLFSSLSTAIGQPDAFESPNYPPAVNFGLGIAGGAARNIPALWPVNGGPFAGMQAPDWLRSIGDWFTKPENQQTGPQIATGPKIDLTKVGQGRPPAGVGPGQMPAPGADASTLLSMDWKAPPAPPALDPFQMPMPPAPGQLPAPPEISPFQEQMPPELGAIPAPPQTVAPDFSAAIQWMDKMQPQQSQVDWKREKLREMFAGLAQGAAGWDPRSGLGGLVASAAGAGSQGVMHARAQELSAQDEFTKAMQDYAARRAQFAVSQAGTMADWTNTNADRQYNWTVGNVERRDKNNFSQFDAKQRNAQRGAEAGAANAENKWRYETAKVQQQDQVAGAKYQTELENLKAIHEANAANAQRMYEYQVGLNEAERPKIVSSTKDGVIVSSIKNGKQVLEHKSFGQYDNAEHLKTIGDAYGKDSSVYKISKLHDQLQQGDQVSIMKDMAKDAVTSGYAQQLFADKYDEARQAVMSELTLDPGSKDYAEAYNEAMARYLLQYIDITNSDQMNGFAHFGNTAAQYLLSGVSNG